MNLSNYQGFWKILYVSIQMFQLKYSQTQNLNEKCTCGGTEIQYKSLDLTIYQILIASLLFPGTLKIWEKRSHVVLL